MYINIYVYIYTCIHTDVSICRVTVSTYRSFDQYTNLSIDLSIYLIGRSHCLSSVSIYLSTSLARFLAT